MEDSAQKRSAFLPDLGKKLARQAAGAAVRTTGVLHLEVLSQYRHECHSITGDYETDGSYYVATFDLTKKSWDTFAQGIQNLLHLDVALPLKAGLVVSKIDPPLPVSIDLVVRLGQITESPQTGEKYRPLVVEHISDLQLVPSPQIIERRHAWWVKQAEQFIDSLGAEAAQLRHIMLAPLPYEGPLAIEGFQKNLLVAYLFRLTTEGKDLESFMSFAQARGWADVREWDKLATYLNTFEERARYASAELKNMCLNLGSSANSGIEKTAPAARIQGSEAP